MSSPVSIVDPDASVLQELDSLMWEEVGGVKRIVLRPASFYDGFDADQLRVWCALNAIYQVPTSELVEFVSNKIAGRTAVEIGSGTSGLFSYLGIQGTDSFLQVKNPEVVDYLKMMRQVPTSPGSNVLEMDAKTALHKLRPEVVVGCWITPIPKCYFGEGGSFYGVDEFSLLKKVKCYIHVGNSGTHGPKFKYRQKSVVYKDVPLVSRAKDASGNHIMVWGD